MSSSKRSGEPDAQARGATRSVRTLAFARVDPEQSAEWILPPSAETSPISFARRQKLPRGAQPVVGASRRGKAVSEHGVSEHGVAKHSAAKHSAAKHSAAPGSAAPSVAPASFKPSRRPSRSGSAMPGASQKPRSASPSASGSLRASLLTPSNLPAEAKRSQLGFEEPEPTPDEIAEAKEAFAQAIVDLAAESARERMTLLDDSVRLALSIAELVIDQELRARPELHSKLVRAAMGALQDGAGAKVRASRESYDLIVETFGGARVDAGHVKVDVVLDESLEGLGVVIDQGDTRVDGRVAARLESMARALESVSKAEAA